MRRSHTPLVLLALAPAIAWGTVIFVAPTFAEDLCNTGAAPDRGRWFGIDARWPTGLLALSAAVIAVACAAALHRRARAAESSDGARFVASVGALSTIPLVASMVGAVVWILWSSSC